MKNDGNDSYEEIDDLYDDLDEGAESEDAGEATDSEGESSEDGQEAESTEGTQKGETEGSEGEDDSEGEDGKATSGDNNDTPGEYDFGDEDGDSTSGEEGEGDGKEGDGGVTGMELWLSKYGIEAGMIPFDDGEEIHFNDLEPDKQESIIDTLIQSKISSVEDKFSLSEDEIAFLNVGRNDNKSVQEVIDQLAAERVDAIIAQREATSVDYKEMSSDGVYMKYLKENSGEDDTAETIQEKLEEAKKSPTYNQLVELLKKDYITKQETDMSEARQVNQKESARELEMEREEIVNSAMGIQNVLGQVVDNEARNEILADLLEVNEYGDSRFMEQVFSDPETMFKVAWIAKHGEESLGAKDDYWKKEVTKAYKRGYNKAVDGMPSASISASKKGGKKVPAKPTENEQDNIDSLYED